MDGLAYLVETRAVPSARHSLFAFELDFDTLWPPASPSTSIGLKRHSTAPEDTTRANEPTNSKHSKHSELFVGNGAQQQVDFCGCRPATQVGDKPVGHEVVPVLGVGMGQVEQGADLVIEHRHEIDPSRGRAVRPGDEFAVDVDETGVVGRRKLHNQPNPAASTSMYAGLQTSAGGDSRRRGSEKPPGISVATWARESKWEAGQDRPTV